MATNFLGAPLVDPDSLDYTIATTSIAADFAACTTPILIDTANRRIALKVTGTLLTDGATIKAVYSKLKEAWRTDNELIKFPFPMSPITDEQFEMVNGWNWDKVQTSGDANATTVELLRTGGWSVVNTAGNITEQWAGIITLGTLADTTDQVYFQQVDESTTSIDIVLTGPVNQAVQILEDPNGDGVFADGFDRRSYFKIFVREYQKLYAQSSIQDIGVSQMTYQAYRFPLTNAADLKITASDVTVDTTEPYTKVNITYLRDANGDQYVVLGNYNPSSFNYVVGNVVRDTGNNRWYKCIVGYTSNATQPSANATNWAAYEGERLIGSTYFPFTVIIDGDTDVTGNTSGDASTVQIYEKIQYQLRQSTDIDAGTGTVTGKTADALLNFVGDTLVTSTGVYIDNFRISDTNAIQFTDSLNEVRTFPYVASLQISFGENLQNDQFAKYWVFFTNDDAGDNTGRDFGTANAIIVDDNDGIDMTGDVNPAWPTKRANVVHSYNYDGNVQRGNASAGVDAPVTVVAIGLATGQYVRATSTIARSTANAVSLVSSLERNYANPT